MAFGCCSNGKRGMGLYGSNSWNLAYAGKKLWRLILIKKACGSNGYMIIMLVLLIFGSWTLSLILMCHGSLS